MDALVVVAAASSAVAAAAALPRSAWGRLACAPAERHAWRWWPRRHRPAPAATAEEVSRTCVLLALCLAAGRPPRSALRVVVDVLEGSGRDALASVLRQVDLGLDEATAWASLAEVPGYRAVGRDLARAVHSGVALADLLRGHARDARREAMVAAQVRARAAGVAGVLPLVVCFLPAFVLLGVVPIFGGLVGRFLG